jgi:hypothetical protein
MLSWVMPKTDAGEAVHGEVEVVCEHHVRPWMWQ